jgi:hypothetical protein
MAIVPNVVDHDVSGRLVAETTPHGEEEAHV